MIGARQERAGVKRPVLARGRLIGGSRSAESDERGCGVGEHAVSGTAVYSLR